MNNKTFQLDIITPTGSQSMGKIEYLRAPSTDGLFGVLANHIPSIIAIGIGEIKITIDGKDEFYATSGGYVDIKKESVSLVLETSENASNIDIKRSEEAMQRANQYLDDSNQDLEFGEEARSPGWIRYQKKLNDK